MILIEIGHAHPVTFRLTHSSNTSFLETVNLITAINIVHSYDCTIEMACLGIFCASVWSYYSKQDVINYIKLCISILMIHVAAIYISSCWTSSLPCVSKYPTWVLDYCKFKVKSCLQKCNFVSHKHIYIYIYIYIYICIYNNPLH